MSKQTFLLFAFSLASHLQVSKQHIPFFYHKQYILLFPSKATIMKPTQLDKVVHLFPRSFYRRFGRRPSPHAWMYR